ncbi:MAG TPA: hypothetical protein VK465_18080, partial [Fibrobacteria bacterium]|nr:hypothetical protein [Fibrobacteria bacterium]
MPIALLFSALLSACFRDDGIVRAGDPIPVLARFTSEGVSFSTSDTSAAFLAVVMKRVFNEMTNPKVALVWQFVGPKEFIRAPGSGTVRSKSTFDFTMELRDPPSPEVLDNVDVSIGQFWLYNDADSNGVLDRLIHPDMVPINAAIDSLYQIYQKDMRDLIASSEVFAEPRLWIDTLLIGKFGTVTVRNGSHEDTLFSGLNPGFAKIGPLNAIGTRFRVLTRQDKWQRFFSLRKRDNDYYAVPIPAPPGYASAVAMTYHRLIFPKPGQERAFEAGCRRIIQSHNTYIFIAEEYLISAEKAGYQEYPYNGDALKKDFVLARSRAHFVIYLRDRSALDLLLTAERSSSFDIRRLDRLKTGYNLIECDDQYRCEVLDQATPVRLDMGMTNEFFNPPASKAEFPVKISPTGPPPAPAVLPAASLTRYVGTYDGLPYGLVHVTARGGDLWADLPVDGLFRLTPVDSMAFLVPPRHIQVQFVPDDSGRIAKLFVLRSRARYVASHKGTVSEGLPARIDALLAPRAATLDGSLIARLEGLAFDYGGDTLRIRHAGGDSLWVTVPGMYPQRT